MKNLQLSILAALVFLLFSKPAHALCTGPAGIAGEMMYNTTYNVMQFCNGTDWIAMGSLNIWNLAGADAYYNAGRVGIGTANPQSALHVYGTANAAKVIAVDAQGTGANQEASLNLLTLGDGANPLGGPGTKGWNITGKGNAYTTAAEQNDLGLRYWNGTVWTTPLWVDSATGNVGIGTTTPTSVVYTVGTPLVTQISKANENAVLILDRTGTSAAKWEIGTNGTSFLVAKGTASNGVTIDTTGNVGIGTTTPATTLQVNGTASATQFNGSAVGLTGIPGLFQRITATRGTSTGTSAPTSCPAGYTLIDWHIYQHAGSNTGSGWNYCLCGQSGNGITAQFVTSDDNPNYSCSCSGLCAKN